MRNLRNYNILFVFNTNFYYFGLFLTSFVRILKHKQISIDGYEVLHRAITAVFCTNLFMVLNLIKKIQLFYRIDYVIFLLMLFNLKTR